MEWDTPSSSPDSSVALSPKRSLEPLHDAPSQRFFFIDGLRGIAALMVLTCHLIEGNGITGTIQAALPPALASVVDWGGFGVQIFFVISGFVIAYSQRNDRVTTRYLGNFILRRSLRLDPAYLLTLLLAISLYWIQGPLLHLSVAAMPGGKQVVVNLFYLQDLTGYGNIVLPCWTLCLEVQFYLIYTGVRLLGNQISRVRGNSVQWENVMFALLTVASVMAASGRWEVPIRGFFLSTWHMFFTGVLVCWIVTGRCGWRWFIVLAGLEFVPALAHHGWVVAVLLMTGSLILLAWRTHNLERWLSGRGFQYFGKRSYSIYLLHTIIGWPILRLAQRLGGRTVPGAWAWFFIASIVSVFSAHLMYRWVEVPGIKLSKRLKYREPVGIGASVRPRA